MIISVELNLNEIFSSEQMEFIKDVDKDRLVELIKTCSMVSVEDMNMDELQEWFNV